MPTLLTHIDRNISSLNSLVDHVDELYALDLAEKNNDMSAIMTLGLTALSLILTFIMLPSFWTDTQSVKAVSSPLIQQVLNGFGVIGTVLGVMLIFVSIILTALSMKQWPKIWKVIKRSLTRLDR